MAYRIGLVLKYLDEEYQSSIFRGAGTEAERLGAELVCIQGDQFDGRLSGSSFFFANSPATGLDGIVFVSSILPDNSSATLPATLKKNFGSTPFVSIGTALEGIPSVISETDEPIEQLVDHLVDDHEYRRFLYLGGPKENNDNRSREAAFRKALKHKSASGKSCSLAVRNAELFSETAALQLMEQYCLAHPERDIDVLLAGSDDMAAGVLKYLRTGAPESWKHCPITGFDDIPLAATWPLSLTTVHQPTERMGAEAVHMLVDLLSGKTPPAVLAIPGETIRRNSCGCRDYQPVVLPEETARALQREQFLRDVSYFGQEIMGASGLEAVERPLCEFLTNVASREFALVLYDSPATQVPDRGRLQLKMSPLSGSTRYRETRMRPLRDIFSLLLESPGVPGSPRCLFHLRSGDTRLGFILYSVDQSVHSYMSLSGMFLSHALRRLYEQEKDHDRARELEQEVEKRTRELKEEALRRREVEEAVLRISDLERLRFSLDLHDDICQRLAAMTMICKKDSRTDPVMKTLFDMASETLQKTRQYAHESFPVEIDSLDISDALSRLCSDMDSGEGPGITFVQEGPITALTREQKINMFRIAQEALQNSIKHSRARKTAVRLEYRPGSLTLSITDDGRGFDNSGTRMVRGNKRRPRGLGIRSMEYRAHQLDGKFAITSGNDRGTTVTVTIPARGEIQ